MVRVRACLVLVLSCLLLESADCLSGDAGVISNAGTNVATESWYSLADDQAYVTNFVLSSNAPVAVRIAAKTPLLVGFNTDVTDAQIQRYSLLTRSSEKYPVSMKQLDGPAECSSLIGAGVPCTPVGGEIRVVFTSRALDVFKVVVFSAAPPTR